MRRLSLRQKLAGIFMLASFVLGLATPAQTLTPENQTIYLRHIVEQTDQTAQRQAALTLLAKAGTYQALSFAASLMDDSAIATSAAATVWDILATHPE